MAESNGLGFHLDRTQVTKAVKALFAYLKSVSASKAKLLEEQQVISLIITLWKIPPNEQSIKIHLPHTIHTGSTEVCLFTRDEPDMSAEKTEAFYKKLLADKNIRYVSEVISYKTLKKEYKPFEAKRRLLSNFDLFLADARIYRLLPTQIGKHFYKSKKVPISVNLKPAFLENEINKVMKTTVLTVTNKGCCCNVKVAHSRMTIEQVVENICVVVGVIAAKLYKKATNIKIIHLKSSSSIALPVYTSPLHHLDDLDSEILKQRKERKEADKAKKTAETLAKKDEELIPELLPLDTKNKQQETPCGPAKKSPRSDPKIKEKTPLAKKARLTSNSALNSPKTPRWAEVVTSLKETKNPKTPKREAKPKTESGKPKRGAPAGTNVTTSAKKAPKTPKRKVQELVVPQTC
ncbi:ribosomal L1 domain-containing protein 1 isoform X2 [Erpetoichthys calabaricus]|uniref:Ribosomal L1 domain-containing protein 1 n=1 Tax=Erpetoichthys calabaricus TaxID=27687 RepID=A0A8C4T006_ERPCA|nr:ribosomal L1 domain-containing protein 1 isoform X2 [Erpetoichthys calabaricus]